MPIDLFSFVYKCTWAYIRIYKSPKHILWRMFMNRLTLQALLWIWTIFCPVTALQTSGSRPKWFFGDFSWTYLAEFCFTKLVLKEKKFNDMRFNKIYGLFLHWKKFKLGLMLRPDPILDVRIRPQISGSD
jgi:hypothetical protein